MCAGTVLVCQKFTSVRKQLNLCLKTFGAHTFCLIISNVSAYKKLGRRQFLNNLPCACLQIGDGNTF